MQNRIFLIIVLVLNLMILLGQIWPEGAPPFARVVNIATIILNLFIVTKLFLNAHNVRHN